MGFDIESLVNGGDTNNALFEIENKKIDLVNLQMVLVTSSMNHEYTRKELEKCRSYAKQQELLVRMTNLKNLYFAARHKMQITNPEKLKAIEEEIQLQKQTVLSEGNLH